jgi:hypothetical protein
VLVSSDKHVFIEFNVPAFDEVRLGGGRGIIVG